MKISFIGHASIYVQTNDLALLCDPVLFDPFCEGINTAHPPRTVSPAELPHYDAIFLSHRHLDHFDIRSMRSLVQPHVEVFIPDDPLLKDLLQEIGFRTIVRLGEFERLNLGKTTLLSTFSRNRVPELGLVVCEGQNTFWNQVDTVSTLASIQTVKGTVGEIDYLLAPWQPLVETAWHITGDGRFPFGQYESLLQEIAWVNAHFITPGACGLRFVDRARALNHIAFPLTPERFRYDIESDRHCSSTVLLANPGDIAILEKNSVHLERTAANWITHQSDTLHHSVLYCPAVLGSPFEKALDCPSKEFSLGHRFEALFEKILSHPAAANLRRWHVIYQLVIEDNGHLHPLWVEFGANDQVWRNGWTPLRNYTVFVSAQLLDALLAISISMSYVVTSGEYRVVNTVYRYYNNKLIRPEEVCQPIIDPLLSVFMDCTDELLLGSLRTELKASLDFQVS
jgi:L-ascorbate metabolism protein UlaG (beta-lactamase superfamily)